MTVYEKTLEFLDNLSYSKRSHTYNLVGILALLECLGDPHKTLSCVHVAGSNGKGSVSALMAMGLTEAGWKTGLSTSPHLLSVRERLRINGQAISKARFHRLIAHIRKKISSQSYMRSFPQPSYFEFLTAAAFLYFSEENVDIAIIEVGLGGRLDATNVIHPLLSIISSIDFDHTHILGATLKKIAKEKAGIIKKAVPVICATRHLEALEPIKALAAAHRARLYCIGTDFDCIDYQIIESPSSHNSSRLYQRNQIRWHDENRLITTQLLGKHQALNVATAYAGISILSAQFKLEKTAVLQGFQKLFWPARLQCIANTDSMIIIDGAHNPTGMQSLRDSLIELHPGQRWTILFSALQDKDWSKLIDLLIPISQCFILVPSPHPKGECIDKLFHYLQEQYPCTPCINANDIQSGLVHLQKMNKGLVTGSLYLAAEVLKVYYGPEPVSIIRHD